MARPVSYPRFGPSVRERDGDEGAAKVMDTDLAPVGPILVKLGALNASGPEMTSEPIGDLSELVGPWQAWGAN